MIIKPRQKGGFSDREKITPFDETIQYTSLNERSRNRLINFNQYIFSIYTSYDSEKICNQIVSNIFVLKTSDFKSFREIQSIVMLGLESNWSYDEIFTYFEGLFEIIRTNQYYYQELIQNQLRQKLNEILEAECVGYRFINDIFISITNKEEIESVNEALSSKFQASRISLNKAISLIYNHDSPDYSNGIKECISAVEAACNQIVGKKSILSNALKIIQTKIPVHPALLEAFIRLYGYTSDHSGIRHNFGDDNEITHAEAQFMLVSCSAFINYLEQLYF